MLVDALAKVDAQDLFFDVKLMFTSVVGAMESYGKNKDAAWDGLLITEMRRSASFKARAAITRDPLNELMSALAVFHEEHNDFARHSSHLAGLSLGSSGAVNTVLSAAEAAPCWGGGGYFDDFARDFDSVYRVGLVRPPRMCPKNLHDVPPSFDYCGDCGLFFPDTYFCRTCNTPTQKSLAERGLCRGRFAFAPCDADDTAFAARRAKKNWTIQDSWRMGPSSEDLRNAAVRHKRLENRRADKRGGNSAFTVSYADEEPAGASPLGRQRPSPSNSPSSTTYSPSPSARGEVAEALVATAVPRARRELGSHPEFTAGAVGLHWSPSPTYDTWPPVSGGMVATLEAEDAPRVRRELGSHPEFTAGSEGMDWSAPATAAPSLLAAAVPGASLSGASTARAKPAQEPGLHPGHSGTLALAWTGDLPPVVHSSPAPAPAAAPSHEIEGLPVVSRADSTARLTPVGPLHTPAFMSGAAS